jgi:hypothetical protein
MDSRIDPRPEENIVYVKYITLRNGKRFYAGTYGLDVFCIVGLLKKCRLE